MSSDNPQSPSDPAVPPFGGSQPPPYPPTGSQPPSYPPPGSSQPPSYEPPSYQPPSYPPPGGSQPGSYPPPGGSQPPPPGWQPPPGGGGYGPPPYQPPPGGSGGYGPPPTGGPSGSGAYSIGDAFNYGWSKFQANIGAILLAVLAYAAAAFVVGIIWFFIVGAIAPAADNNDGLGFGLFVSSSLFSLVWVILGYVIQAGIIRGALAITYGRKIEMQTLISMDQIVPVLIGSLIVAVATSIGFLLCFIPGLVVAFFAQFFMFFIIDKKMEPVEAIKASFTFVNKNLATLVGFYLASVVAIFIGALLCGVGLIVAFPVVVIAQAYTYRKLQGETVAA